MSSKKLSLMKKILGQDYDNLFNVELNTEYLNLPPTKNEDLRWNMITFEDEVAFKLLQLKNIPISTLLYFKVKESISNINKCIDDVFEQNLKLVRFANLLIELLEKFKLFFTNGLDYSNFLEFNIDEYSKKTDSLYLIN